MFLRIVVASLLMAASVAAGDSEWAEGVIKQIEQKSAWQMQTTKAAALFSGPAVPVKATLYVIEVGSTTLTVAHPAASVFSGYRKPLGAIGDKIEIAKEKDGFWTGSKVEVRIGGKKTKLFLDSKSEK